MVLKDEKVLQVLDKIGFFISLVTLCILMLVLVQANIYFLIIFGILFIFGSCIIFLLRNYPYNMRS